MEAIWKDSEGKPVIPGDIHHVIWEFLDKAAEARVPALVLAPRSIGKTETGLALVARRIAKRPFIRYQIISDILENAQDRLGSIRHYFEKDDDFRYYYPEIQIDRSKRGRRTLNKLRLTANKYAKDPTLEACGAFGGSTGHRADEQFYDDLCTERNSVLAPADRERLKKVFFKTWTPILVPGGWWFYIGTVYHSEDLTHALLGNTKVAHLKIGLSEDFSCYDAEEWWPGMDEEEKKPVNPKRYTIPLWVEGGWDEPKYRSRYDEMMASGDASAFMGQYRNILIDPETADFRPEWFDLTDSMRDACYMKKDARGEPVRCSPRDYIWRVLYADPAFSKEKEACFYTGGVMGYKKDSECGVVLHSWRTKEGLSKRVDRYLDAVEEWEPNDTSIEGQHEGGLAERIEERAIERGIGIRLRRITHGKEEKVERIRAIAPLVQHKKIVADPRLFPYFKQEALFFPKGKKDSLDTLQGLWERTKSWMRRRNYVPKTFPSSQQMDSGTIPTRRRYHFQGPTRADKERPKSIAQRFFG